jgi:hypothetical protein
MKPKPLSAITFLIVPCGIAPLLQRKIVKKALNRKLLFRVPFLVEGRLRPNVRGRKINRILKNAVFYRMQLNDCDHCDFAGW